MKPSQTKKQANQKPVKPEDTLLRIFVYGTLKRGYWNHDRFCSQAVSIEPATTWGRLYHLPAGYPALEVPESSILAHGTTDPLTDTQTQNKTIIPQSAFRNPQSNDWDLIHGELMTFDNPIFDLPPIDRLEGFNPCGRSMYRRVLVAGSAANQIEPVWLYHYALAHNGRRIMDGNWIWQ